MVGREGEGVWSRDVLDVALHGDGLLPARLHPPRLAPPPIRLGSWPTHLLYLAFGGISGPYHNRKYFVVFKVRCLRSFLCHFIA